MSDSSGEDMRMTPMEKMRIRVAAEAYSGAMKDRDNNNYEPLATETHHLTKTPEVAEDEPKICSSTLQIFVFLIILLSIVIIVFTTLLIVGVLYQDDQYCKTTECLEVSSQLLKNMDLSAEPCVDFYQYACGGFTADPLIPPEQTTYTWSHFLTRTVMSQTKRLLDEEGSLYQGKTSKAIAKVKLYYKVCMNTSATEAMGTEPLRDWLSSVLAWKNLSVVNSEPSIEDTLANLYSYDMKALFRFSVGTDDKNRNVNIMKFDQVELSFEDYSIYNGSKSEVYRQIYTEYFTSTMKAIFPNDTSVLVLAEKMWTFETQLASIMDSAASRANFTAVYHKMTIDQLQRILDESKKAFNLSKFLLRLFKEDVPGTESIVVYSPNYFSKLGKILQDTSTKVVANYLLWMSIQEVLPYQPREVREPRSVMYSKMYSDSSSVYPHWLHCVHSAQSALPGAMAALYVQRYFTEKKKLKASELAVEMGNTFKSQLQEVKWMDRTTLQSALAKIEALTYKIAYPQYIKDVEKLDRKYEQLKVTNTTVFNNYLDASTFSTHITLNLRNKPPDKTQWLTAPTRVTAFNDLTLNQVVFSAAVLNPPFYSTQHPMAMNYGSMGFIMGRQIAHGFDDKGNQFNEYGNLENWWSSSSSQHFQQKAQCLVEQYDKYPVGDTQVNGSTTLNENIADSIGVRTSYRAYETWLESQGHSEKEARLPGLNTTEQQLFFLAFAQTLCTYYNPAYEQIVVASDSHAYAKYRVIGTLSNIPEFSAAYSCLQDSPMNPNHKCSVWPEERLKGL